MPSWWWRALIGPCSHVTSRWCQISTPGVSPTLHYRVYSNWSLATYPFFSSSEIYAFSLNCHFRSTCLTTKASLDIGNMHTATLLSAPSYQPTTSYLEPPILHASADRRMRSTRGNYELGHKPETEVSGAAGTNGGRDST